MLSSRLKNLYFDPKPITVSEELKAIFLLENKLLKQFPKTGNKAHDWWREQIMHHIEQFNKTARLLDSRLLNQSNWHSSLAHMKIAELASAEQQQLFDLIKIINPDSNDDINKLYDLMDIYLIGLKGKLFIRLRDADQLNVMEHLFDDDSSSELFPYPDNSSDNTEISEEEPEEIKACTPKPAAFQPQFFSNNQPLSVKERAKKYERERMLEYQHSNSIRSHV